jgi:hypothetical protein
LAGIDIQSVDAAGGMLQGADVIWEYSGMFAGVFLGVLKNLSLIFALGDEGPSLCIRYNLQ